jgi:hypothetical protein
MRDHFLSRKASINEWNYLTNARFGAGTGYRLVASPKGSDLKVDFFSLMLLATQHVQANFEQPTCRQSGRNFKWVKVMKFFNGTGRAKESDGSRGTAILIDILIRTVASR